jgi:hypothetical protein
MSSSNGGSNSHKPKNLDKMKSALRRIVRVPKEVIDAELAKEREHKRTRKP